MMSDAAHPQPSVPDDPEQGDGLAAVKNPFPQQMVVPGHDGSDVVVELAVVDGVVYAPGLDDYPISYGVRAYVTQYCAAWSSSVVTADRLEHQWPEPPRRARVVFNEAQLHTMLGLAADERLLRAYFDEDSASLTFVVESPRLPRLESWGYGPPYVRLPIAAAYEAPLAVGA